MLATSFAEIISLGSLIPFITAITSPKLLLKFEYFNELIVFLNCTSRQDILILITVFFIVSTIFATFLRVFLLRYQTKLSFSIGNDISQTLYEKTLNQSYLEHVSRNSSEVISGIINKSSIIVTGVILPYLNVISSFFILISLMSVLLLVNALITIITFALFGLLYYVILKLTKYEISNISDRINKEEVQVIKSLQEGLGGIRDVLLHGSQDFYINIFSISNLKLQNARSKVQIISGSPKFIIEGFGMIFISLVALSVSLNPFGTINSITLIGTLALGAQKLLPLLQIIFSNVTSIRSAQSSLNDIINFLKKDSKFNYNLNHGGEFQFNFSIKLKNVTFKYLNKPTSVFQNANIEISKGEVIGIIGKTGSGKSTLLDIIMGLIFPDEGGLFIDDVKIDSQNLRQWQNIISHVPQSIYLSDSSIMNNIAFGISNDNIDFSRVRLAAKLANISDLIESWENGYETIIGERGIMLSGGQRQRIGLARAFYMKSSVVVFDEATSSLDNETEGLVMEAVYNLSKIMTIIIVAHRHSTLNKCNKVFEVKDGKILVSSLN